MRNNVTHFFMVFDLGKLVDGCTLEIYKYGFIDFEQPTFLIELIVKLTE